MDKLLGEFLKEEPIQDKDPEQWQDLVRLKVS